MRFENHAFNHCDATFVFERTTIFKARSSDAGANAVSCGMQGGWQMRIVRAKLNDVRTWNGASKTWKLLRHLAWIMWALASIYTSHVPNAAAESTGTLPASPSAAKKPSVVSSVTTGSIAAFYPDIAEPTRSAYLKIIEGVEEGSGSSIARYAINASTNTQELASEMLRRDTKVIVALGRNGMKAAAGLGLGRNVEILASAIVTMPGTEFQNMSIISVAPDPAMLFGRLKSFVPQAKRIFVAYDPQTNAWLIRLASQAAKTHKLELVAKEASDLNTAVRFYQEFLDKADPKRDVLWLPQDTTTVQDSVVLPMVLRGAWSRNLTLMSSNVNHVKHGVLFALFPDNFALGKKLGALALEGLSGRASAPGFAALKELKIAVNLRAADHLGIQLSPQQQQEFDLLLPEQ